MKGKKLGLIIIGSIIIIGGIITLIIISRPPDFELDELRIYIGDEELELLSEFRDEALEKGFLERSPNDFVTTNIKYHNESLDGKVRLKGDWTDHLGEDKWSFRIKLENAMSDGLQVFSVQNPQARGFLDGYVYHLLLKEEGVLSTEFRFVELYINDESWGVYSLEEHLTSRMIANQNKPEGVILKFNDQDFFKASIDSTETEGLIRKAEIKVYGDAKDNPSYKREIDRAKRIIENYQNQTDSVYNNFDPYKMGMYYAICDLATAYHAMGWINIRFYYNFETHKMEPVGYDAYPMLEWGKPYLGLNSKNAQMDPFKTEMIVYKALKNDAIEESYYEALKKVTDPSYVKQFLEKYDSQLKFLEKEIQKEYSHYEYDYTFLSNTAKEINVLLE